MKNIVVLISGNGSNLQSIINSCKQKKINDSVCAVFSDKSNAAGLKKARDENIPTHVLPSYHFKNHKELDNLLIKKIDFYSPALIVLAGYMRILGNKFVDHYSGRLLNIHPSLLPKYTGLYTHRRVLKNGDTEHGTSIHFVTHEIDKGPIILQAKVPIYPEDTEDKIIHRVKIQENFIYPIVVKWFIDGRLIMYDNSAWLDGIKLPNQGLLITSYNTFPL